MLLRHEAFARLCRARQLLAEVNDPPVPLADIARETGVSLFHFIRQFEALFGMTPHQFRIQARLDHAKTLLAEGEHSVTEVCMEVGMSSVGSFSDLFSRRTGSSPTEFQRRAQAAPHEVFPGCLSLMGLLPAGSFRNFEEALPAAPPVESAHANQADQSDGRRSRQGTEVLHGNPGLSEEARDPDGPV
jgi:AraC-like DNA-binding protein